MSPKKKLNFRIDFKEEIEKTNEKLILISCILKPTLYHVHNKQIQNES